MDLIQMVTERKKLYEAINNSRKAKRKAYVATPFVGPKGYEIIIDKVNEASDVRFIVDFSDDPIRKGSTRPSGVKGLLAITKHVRSLKNLHAKIYLFDDKAIVTSANLSNKAFSVNHEIGIILETKKKVAEIEDFFLELWDKSKPISLEDVEKGEKLRQDYKNKLKGAGIPDSYGYKGGDVKFPLKKPKKQLNLDTLERDGHILININWSPNNYEKRCTEQQKSSIEQKLVCHEHSDCISWGPGEGCTSSEIFKDFRYFTSWKAIRKGRIAFFIAKNPNIGRDYYLVGFLYMKSSVNEGERGRWVKFEADRNKSVRLNSSEKKMIMFNKPLIDKLDLIDWSKMKKGQKVAKYIGPQIRNPRYITDKEAKTILEECLKKTKNPVIKDILEKDFI